MACVKSAPGAIHGPSDKPEANQTEQLAKLQPSQWRWVPVFVSFPQIFQHKSNAAATSTRIVPVEERQPEPSIGSQLHGIGQCKPCAWFWRPQGCSNGPECRHCHLCSTEENKNRKKQ